MGISATAPAISNRKRRSCAALAVSETIGDTESVQFASLLNNLGEVYRQKHDYGRAEDLLRRSLALGESVTGPDSYFVATALQNLGIIARERKDYATAIDSRAGAVDPRAHGRARSSDVAHILTNLANVYRATGDYQGRSRPIFGRWTSGRMRPVRISRQR